MRFILKCAFLLGLAAFLLPFGQGRSDTEVEMSWLGAFAGVQEAFQDLSGFCDRAPRACETGREMALFAGERIGDGVAIAYDFVEGHMNGPATEVAAEPGRSPPLAGGSTDPLLTGAVEADPRRPLPRAYLPPRHPAAEAAAAVVGVDSHWAEAVPPQRAPVVPTPAPRG